jgi:hypothetical protein
MEYNQLYFYTSTIRGWKPLLKQFNFEPLILDSLNFLFKKEYAVDWNSRHYNFWVPDADWFLLNNESTILQKLNYMHENPMQKHWILIDDPLKYPYSSAKFYGTEINDFEFLTDFRDYKR